MEKAFFELDAGDVVLCCSTNLKQFLNSMASWILTQKGIDWNFPHCVVDMPQLMGRFTYGISRQKPSADLHSPMLNPWNSALTVDLPLTLTTVRALASPQPAVACQSALIYCYLCRDGCWIMWPCYGLHITVSGIPCLCALSASAFIDSALHQLDFFLELFFMET